MDGLGSLDRFVFEDFRFHLAAGGLFRTNDAGASEPVALNSRAVALLALLVERHGQLVSKDDIFAAVWPRIVVGEGSLTVQISALRRVLDHGRTQGSCIQTIPGRGYRFVAPVMRVDADAHSVAQIISDDGGRSRRLSIVVLPFPSLSDDREQQYFADAITEDLTTDLARIPGSFVIARTTAFAYKGKAVDVRQVARELGVRYVLEGSVRRLGERLQVNVQLLDGETGSHVWTDRFDTDLHDLAEAQREIVGRMASPLGFELIKDVGRRIEQESGADPDASTVALRAHALRVQTLPSDVQARRAMVAPLESALILDPDTIDARIQLAAILVGAVADGISASMEQDKARSEQLIIGALQRLPNHSDAHRVMGQLRRCQGRWAESQMELERALELDPNNTLATHQLGITVLAQGKPDAAMPHFERGIRRQVRHRNLFNLYINLGRCHLFSGHIGEAVELLRRGRMLAPDMWYVHLELAGALSLVGNLEDAKSEIAESVKLKPEINSIARWRTLAVTLGHGHPQFQALREKTTYAGLRAVEFPEE